MSRIQNTLIEAAYGKARIKQMATLNSVNFLATIMHVVKLFQDNNITLSIIKLPDILTILTQIKHIQFARTKSIKC